MTSSPIIHRSTSNKLQRDGDGNDDENSAVGGDNGGFGLGNDEDDDDHEDVDDSDDCGWVEIVVTEGNSRQAADWPPH